MTWAEWDELDEFDRSKHDGEEITDDEIEYDDFDKSKHDFDEMNKDTGEEWPDED